MRVDLFGRDSASKTLKEHLKRNEGYLLAILHEYADNFSARSNTCIDKPILISGALRAFIEKKGSEQINDENEQTSNMRFARKLISRIIEEKVVKVTSSVSEPTKLAGSKRVLSLPRGSAADVIQLGRGPL